MNLQGLPESYEPGDTYRLTVTLADQNARRWGFELTALKDNNSRGGTIAVVQAQATQLSGGNNQPQYIKHRSAGTFPGQVNNASWQFDWTAPAEGAGRITFYVTGNAANNDGGTGGDRIYGSEHPLTEAVPPPPPPRDSLVVSLVSGWNLISSAVAPDSMSVIDIFDPLVDAGVEFILRDGAGRVHNPTDQIHEIGNWSIFSSYQIKVSRNTAIKFSGEFVDPSRLYMIEDGWNWISYPRMDTVHPSQVFDAVGFAASLIRDGKGHFAIPGLHVSSLPMIMPGDGLMIQGDAGQAFEFVWPEPNRELEPPAEHPLTTHFEHTTNTGKSMSLMVTGWDLRGEVTEGDEIGIRSTDGMLIGSAVVTGDTTLVTVWGDDDMTEVVDGAVVDDTLRFTYWYAAGDSEEVTMAMGLNAEAVLYISGELMEIHLATPPNEVKDAIGISATQFQLNGLYPNPFNPVAELSFTLSEAGPVSIGLFDINGRELRDFGTSHLSEGPQRFAIDGEGLPPGVYLVGVETNGVTKLTRAVLLK